MFKPNFEDPINSPKQFIENNISLFDVPGGGYWVQFLGWLLLLFADEAAMHHNTYSVFSVCNLGIGCLVLVKMRLGGEEILVACVLQKARLLTLPLSVAHKHTHTGIYKKYMYAYTFFGFLSQLREMAAIG